MRASGESFFPTLKLLIFPNAAFVDRRKDVHVGQLGNRAMRTKEERAQQCQAALPASVRGLNRFFMATVAKGGHAPVIKEAFVAK